MTLRSISLVLALTLAGACAQPIGMDRDQAHGTATAQNIAAMRGLADATNSLARRFAAEAPSTVNFAFNSSRLSAQARQRLDAQADWIRQFPELRLRIYGHTDLVGSASYNRRLGLRRARAVVAYLRQRGIGSARLEAVASQGETQPLVATPGPEPRNRRTVTEVSGFTRRAATSLNGQYANVIMRGYVASARAAPELGGVVPGVGQSRQ